MEAIAEPQVIIRKLSPAMKTPRPDGERDNARRLFLEGLTLAQIAEQTGIPYKTLDAWRTRQQWNNAKVQAMMAIASRIASGPPNQALDDKSKATRNALAGILQNHCATLAASPPKSIAELANTKDGQGQASILKTLADAGAVIHDWKDNRSVGVLFIGDSLQEEEPAIEVSDSEQPPSSSEPTGEP